MRFDSAMNRPVRAAPLIQRIHDPSEEPFDRHDGSYMDNSAMGAEQNAWLQMQQAAEHMERLDDMEPGANGEES